MKNSEMLSEKYVQSGTEGLREPLVRYFASLKPEASDMAVLGLDTPPADSGFSAENFFVDLSWVEGGMPRSARYVVRRQAKTQMFPGKDFSQERRIQAVLSTRTDLPVPGIVAFEDDPNLLQGRFYVMEWIAGATPPSLSPHESGMLVELSMDARRKLWFSGLAELGKLHRLEPFELGLDFASRPAADGSQLTSLLDYWERHYLESSGGNPLALMVEAMAWLRKNRPREAGLSLLWGDSRIGNMLFDDEQNCVGIVDWELASLGDPLQDLAYWTYSDDHFVHISSSGACGGWPTLDETIEAYETARKSTVNRRLLAYYRVVAGYWIVCTLNQLVAIKKQVGQLPAEVEVSEKGFSPVSFFRTEFEAARAGW